VPASARVWTATGRSRSELAPPPQHFSTLRCGPRARHEVAPPGARSSTANRSISRRFRLERERALAVQGAWVSLQGLPPTRRRRRTLLAVSRLVVRRIASRVHRQVPCCSTALTARCRLAHWRWHRGQRRREVPLVGSRGAAVSSVRRAAGRSAVHRDPCCPRDSTPPHSLGPRRFFLSVKGSLTER
jgi:hypothetical protein